MKPLYIVISLFLLGGLAVTGTSCKDDEVPKSTIGFATDELTAFESDGVIDVIIEFDRPLSENATIKFTVGGTADENISVQPDGDFNLPDGKTFTVNKGESQAKISVELLEDFDFEVFDEGTTTFETITLTLTEVSGNAMLGTSKTFTLSVEEDDLILILDWDREPDDVDMDLLVWYLDPDLEAYRYLGGSVSLGTDFELINVPGGFANGFYGLGFPYYSGGDDDLSFSVDYINFGGKINGANEDVTYFGHFSAANINPWETADQTSILQEMKKTGLDYSEITEITIPESGSRKRTPVAPDMSRLKASRKSTISPGVRDYLLRLAGKKK